MTNQSHSQTIRQKIVSLLNDKEMTAREISQAIGIREREVYEHLPHIALSAMAQKRKLVVLPFGCMSCGYMFEQRKRFTRPSRCPRCRKTHLETPVYRLVQQVAERKWGACSHTNSKHEIPGPDPACRKVSSEQEPVSV